MNREQPFHVKLVHCGNENIANPGDRKQKNIFFMPMGIFPLANCLQEGGVDVEIIHMDLEKESPIEDIFDFDRIDAIGFDLHWANQGLVVIETLELIKKINPDIFIFLGGFTASFFAKEILEKHPAVNAVIRGDSEEPIVQLCNTLQNGRDLEAVPNLTWRDNLDNKQAIKENPHSYVATADHLEELDFANVELMRNWGAYRDLSRFWTRFEAINSCPLFLLQVGRGCSYSCSICGGNARAQSCINNRTGQIHRSHESIIQTIKKGMQYGFSHFYVCCDFEGSDRYYIQLLEKLDNQGIRITFGYGCWRLPSRELVETMSRCCENVIIELSPETGDYELRIKNRDPRIGFTNEELEERLDDIEAAGNIMVQLYFGYFIPFDTRRTVYATLGYIERLSKKYAPFTEFFYVNCSTDPGSLLYLSPEKYRVEIQVRCFEDYLAKIRESYVTSGGSALSSLDMTAFKPMDMSPAEHGDLSIKITLFNTLMFFFTESVSVLSEKAKNDTILADYLATADLSAVDGELTPYKAKRALLSICQKYIMLNGTVINSINSDFERASKYKANLML
jgi:radical SAM superfamily enzyme YgiQ (UPF0313 family)